MFQTYNVIVIIQATSFKFLRCDVLKTVTNGAAEIKKYLKPDAVPSIFDFLQCSIKKRENYKKAST